MARSWKINIDNFLGGYAPAYYKETYPSFGNKNMAGAMQNIDLTNAGFLTQGPGRTVPTNGSQAGAVTTLIKGILEQPTSADVTFAVGGNLLHKLSNTAVIDDATWPHTINKAVVTGEDGEDVAAFRGVLYYSYNHSGSAGDIGTYNLDATFDDDWGSTVPTGAAALTNNPHPMCVGGNDTLAIGNGRYLAIYDGTTLDTQALDLPTGSVVVDVQWNQDRWWVTTNNPNVSGANKNNSSIFVWDGTTTSWEAEIKLMGLGGGSHVKNGVLFQFYQDLRASAGYKLGYISGNGVVDLASYDGELPGYWQITDFQDFISWLSDDDVFMYGSGDKDLPLRLFQYAQTTHGEGGGLANPFGSLIAASWDSGSNYNIVKFANYDVTSNWKSLMFDITGSGRSSQINTVRINFEVLAAGARVDWKLLNNQGVTVYSDIISHTKLGAVTTAWYNLKKNAENLRLEFDFASGSATVPVKLKNATIYGTSE